MTINVKTNGYQAATLQTMIKTLNQAAEKCFPGCEVNHFYYGDKLSFTDILLSPGHHASFSITENEIHLNGYECSKQELIIFQDMTHNDWLYNGKLFEIINK